MVLLPHSSGKSSSMWKINNPCFLIPRGIVFGEEVKDPASSFLRERVFGEEGQRPSFFTMRMTAAIDKTPMVRATPINIFKPMAPLEKSMQRMTSSMVSNPVSSRRAFFLFIVSILIVLTLFLSNLSPLTSHLKKLKRKLNDVIS